MQIPSTLRLRFQLMSDTDAELLYEVDQDERVMQFISGGKKSSWQDIQERMLPRMNAYRDPTLGYGIYAVYAQQELTLSDSPFELSAGTYLGWILVRPMNFFTTGAEPDNLELGWRFKRCCWGLGIASEAAAAVAQSVIEQLQAQPMVVPVRAISAIALPDNHASIAVMKKLGMAFVKQYIHHDPLGDYDVVLYQRLVENEVR